MFDEMLRIGDVESILFLEQEYLYSSTAVLQYSATSRVFANNLKTCFLTNSCELTNRCLFTSISKVEGSFLYMYK
jgi:hypothetical protein